MARRVPPDRGPGSNQFGDKPPRRGGSVPSENVESLRAQARRATRTSVDEHIVAHAIERVQPMVTLVNRTLEQNQRDLASADRDLAEGNPRRAFQTAYDLAQQAIEAHMNANGLRTTSGEGSHRVVVEYAFERLAALVGEEVLNRYEQMRRLRHGLRYPFSANTLDAGPREAATAITTARTLHDAVLRWWIQRQPKRST